MHKGINSTLDEGQTPVITHSLRGEGFDASEDGTGRGTPLVPVMLCDHVCVCGHEYFAHENALCPQCGGGNGIIRGEVCEVLVPVCHVETMPTMTAGGPSSSSHNQTSGQMRDQYIVPVAFPANLSGTQCASAEDIAPSMGAKNPTAVAFQERGREDGRSLEIGGDVAYALTAPNGGGRAQERNVLTPAMQVRRLTPIECERLQGFPDGYTQIPWRKKPADQCPDGPRYKALGNSWAVPNVRWIGWRIASEMFKDLA